VLRHVHQDAVGQAEVDAERHAERLPGGFRLLAAGLDRTTATDSLICLG